jgi:hypothetical protein
MKKLHAIRHLDFVIKYLRWNDKNKVTFYCYDFEDNMLCSAECYGLDWIVGNKLEQCIVIDKILVNGNNYTVFADLVMTLTDNGLIVFQNEITSEEMEMLWIYLHKCSLVKFYNLSSNIILEFNRNYFKNKLLTPTAFPPTMQYLYAKFINHYF